MNALFAMVPLVIGTFICIALETCGETNNLLNVFFRPQCMHMKNSNSPVSVRAQSTLHCSSACSAAGQSGCTAFLYNRTASNCTLLNKKDAVPCCEFSSQDVQGVWVCSVNVIKYICDFMLCVTVSEPMHG